MFKDIDFGNNVVKKTIFTEINVNAPLYLQEFSLLEDILLIEYSNSYVLDVGWYPELDLDGHFSVLIVKDENWGYPVFKEDCKNITELLKTIECAVKIVDSIL